MNARGIDQVEKGLNLLWSEIKELFTEHHFITIVAGFFVVLMVLAFYRFLRSINPALVWLVLAIALVILLLHWTQTRTEPRFLKGFIDAIAPFFPQPYRR